MDPISRVVAAGAAGAGAAGAALYVDDVFSTNVYTGTGSAQTITHNIDLAGKGGLIWMKSRSQSSSNHALWASETTGNDGQAWGHYLSSDATNPGQKYSSSSTGSYPQVTSTSHTTGWLSTSSQDFVNWTFRKAPGFFDVVTYSGDGNSSQVISHSLGCVPGMIIIKRTNATDTWYVYHRSLGATKYLSLSSNTNASQATTGFLNNTEPTSSNFTVGSAFYTNSSSGTYVAYLFAHDCADFGANSNEDVIQCGSYTGTGSSGLSVNLGFEPQWLLVKNTSSSNTNWHIFDTMRGLPVGASGKYLEADTSNQEGSQQAYEINATGFQVTATGVDWNLSGDVYAYVAIRRPHKPPEAGTDVFAIDTKSVSSANTPSYSANFPVDLAIRRNNITSADSNEWCTRITNSLVYSNTTGTEVDGGSTFLGYFAFNNGWATDTSADSNDYLWMLKRAPGFFDVATWTGDGVTGRTINHNLTVAPEFMLVKRRSGTENWYAYHKQPGATKSAFLNSGAFGSSSVWNDTEPTATTIALLGDNAVNGSGETYVGYFWATLSGISKVGSYSGTGNNVDVDCGFAAGARFVLIKRTDSTGDWYAWDSTRGIVSGNDPYILLNTTAAQVTNTDYLDPLNAGFTVTSSAPAALNTSGGTYLFLAIA